MNDHYKTHGAFSWNELMTTDVEGAKKFYAGLFGWEYELFEGMEYSVVKAAGQKEGQAGIMTMPPDVPPGTRPSWGGYVTVDDVDATAQKAKSLGGQLLFGPMDIPKVGRFAVIQDPQGAVISAITYKMEM